MGGLVAQSVEQRPFKPLVPGSSPGQPTIFPVPVWAADGQSVLYTAQVGANVELCQITLAGGATQLTTTPAGTLHYHPQPSPDGQWLLYGSKREGVRQLFVMRLAERSERRLTDLSAGRGAMWPHWQSATSDDH